MEIFIFKYTVLILVIIFLQHAVVIGLSFRIPRPRPPPIEIPHLRAPPLEDIIDIPKPDTPSWPHINAKEYADIIHLTPDPPMPPNPDLRQLKIRVPKFDNSSKDPSEKLTNSCFRNFSTYIENGTDFEGTIAYFDENTTDLENATGSTTTELYGTTYIEFGSYIGLGSSNNATPVDSSTNDVKIYVAVVVVSLLLWVFLVAYKIKMQG